MKILLNVVGAIAVVLAILGIFLPLLPTTPFLLLASACFVRGSERMHRWLLANRVFGEYLRNIEEKRGMPRRGKIYTLALLWGSVAYSVVVVQAVLLKLMLLAIATGVTIVILRLKTLEPSVQSEDSGHESTR